MVAGPQEGDEVLDDERVFIDPDAAELLDDKLLDADVLGEDVQFSLDVQAESQIAATPSESHRLGSARTTRRELWT